MKTLFQKIIGSFDNSPGGFSARKLTSFALMFCIGYIHYKFIDLTNAIEALIIDLCGVLIALGIVTAEQVIKLKNGDSKPDKQE